MSTIYDCEKYLEHINLGHQTLGDAQIIHHDFDLWDYDNNLIFQPDEICWSKRNSIQNLIYDNNFLNSITYITVNPSREFLYSKRGFMSMFEQYVYIRNALYELKINTISISCEHGSYDKDHYKTFFHFHLILRDINPKQLHSFYDYFTAMHKINITGKQTAVLESIKTENHMITGINYFTGFLTSGDQIRRKGDHLFTSIENTNHKLTKKIKNNI